MISRTCNLSSEKPATETNVPSGTLIVSLTPAILVQRNQQLKLDESAVKWLGVKPAILVQRNQQLKQATMNATLRTVIPAILVQRNQQLKPQSLGGYTAA